MKRINKILKYDLCIGCGICEAIATSEKCKMTLSKKGFYYPVFKEEIMLEEENKILELCPGISVKNKHSDSVVYGALKGIMEAWSTNSDIRYKAASGGVVTSLAMYLIENKKVDSILHVGVDKGTYLYNSLKISKTREDILLNSSSRYAPALVFDNIFEILDKSEEKIAFIGKPCDIAVIDNLIEQFPKYQGRILYKIAIWCAGIPSYNGTMKILNNSKRKESPISLKYRGEGWPGSFTATYSDGLKYTMSYEESWMKNLGRTVGFRCKICPDGIGMLADIAVGDSWDTKDGYPSFEEAKGRSFVMLRTNKGLKLFNDAQKANYIEIKKFNLKMLNTVHSYQYNRRLMSGCRYAMIQLHSGFLLRFKGLDLVRLAMKLSLYKVAREMFGTYKRLK